MNQQVLGEQALAVELAQLRARVEELESLVKAQAAGTATRTERAVGATRARRRLLSAALVPVVLLVGGTALAHLSDATGEILKQFMDFSSTHVNPPPLDTMVRWQRRDPAGVGAGYTNEIVTLVTEAEQQNSYSWPLYVELRGTTHPSANQDSSQSVAVLARALNRSPGSPWLVGMHSEIAHGRNGLDNGSIVNANGTSILFNGEMRSYSSGGRTIGMNLQCTQTDSNTRACDRAINIQSSSPSAFWQDAIHFDSSPSQIAGNIGINFGSSKFNMGINMGDNSIRLNAGQKIHLELYGTIYLWYNPATSRVELVKFGQKVAEW